MPTHRYKLTVAYRGTNYHGWQKQMAANTWKGPKPPAGWGIPTVQELLSRALAKVLNHPVSIVGSSRTDAGVHAKGQIAHFDTDQTQIPLEGMRRAVNHKLPEDILVRSIEPVGDNFDAIFSTVSKRYQYSVWRGLDRNPLSADLCWHRWKPMDVDAMQAAAEYLVGEHDFTSFARPGHGRFTSVRTLLDCRVSAAGNRVVFGLEGTGFLWNMVRIIVGTLVEVGWGRFKPEDMPAMLAARDRRASGSTAPPHGLYLQWVKTRGDHEAIVDRVQEEVEAGQ
jgi:tRNA pseudouridine38-40 synthase